MFFFINFFFVIFLHIFIKFIFKNKSFNFKKITYVFLIFYSIFIIAYIFNLLDFQKNKENIIYLIINFLLFISYILTIGLKKINSPTFYILEFFKIKNKTNKYDIIKYLEDKKIFENRFKELEEENMISLKNNEMKLTKHGKIFASFMKTLSIFFKIESRG